MITTTRACHFPLAVLLLFAVCRMATAQTAQPPLSIAKLNSQTVVVSWFGASGITYQLERSSNQQTWILAGPAVTGANAAIAVNFTVTGQPRAYFRLKPAPPAANTAIFTPATGLLRIAGTDVANVITVSRNAAGTILINTGAMAITGGTPTVANTRMIEIYGRSGDDVLTLDESSGALPPSRMYGEAGADVLTGGSGADALHGGAGNDTLLGKGGADVLLGGADNDTLTGGDANDEVFGEDGNDRMIWNPGDDTDMNEGGAGTDTGEVNGGGGAEAFLATANGTRIRFDRTDPAPFSIDIGTSENLTVSANGGNDTFSASGIQAGLISLTVDGGSGNDTLSGSAGADIIIGGDGVDTIDGNQGNDTLFGGAGADTFVWDPGDGSDVIEGQTDADLLRFNGSNASENITLSRNGSRVAFQRDIGNIIMDIDDVESIEYNALGGTDNVIVNNLAGTDATSFIANLAATGGGGDSLVDNITFRGSTGDDVITAYTTTGSDFRLTGYAGFGLDVTVTGFDSAQDKVTIQTVEGDDIVDASAVPAGMPALVVEGGAGNDIFLGGAGADNLNGGDNDDTLLGGGGTDTLDGGAGENVLLADGPGVTETIVNIIGDANANTLTISRDAAGALFLNGTVIAGATVANRSLIRVFGLGGNDTLTLDESSGALPPAYLFGGAGTDTLTGGSGADFLFGGINNDTLLGKGGADSCFGGSGNDTITGGDANDSAWGEADNDRIIWNPGDDTDINEGGGGTDVVEVNGGGGAETFAATAASPRVTFARTDPAPFTIDIGACESLVLNCNGGDDTFSAAAVQAGLILFTLDGGPGNDTLSGSAGADIIIGGDGVDTFDGNQGFDTLFGGAGGDTFLWDPGDGNDVIEGQTDSDILVFNGSGAAENITLSPNGGRVTLLRNVGNIVMDIDDVENIEYNAFAGTDNLTVNSLAGTDVTMVIADLAASGGGGDSGVDTITLNGTAAVDNFSLGTLGTAVTVFGIVPTVRIFQSEVANDRVVLNGLGGTDTISTGAGVTALIDVDFNQ